jgi:hypothetical protein
MFTTPAQCVCIFFFVLVYITASTTRALISLHACFVTYVKFGKYDLHWSAPYWVIIILGLGSNTQVVYVDIRRHKALYCWSVHIFLYRISMWGLGSSTTKSQYAPVLNMSYHWHNFVDLWYAGSSLDWVRCSQVLRCQDEVQYTKKHDSITSWVQVTASSNISLYWV